MVFKTGPVSRTELPADRKASAVRVISFDKVRTAVSPDSGNVALTLSVLGRFDIEYLQDVKIRETAAGRTAFGFFPWTFADRPAQSPGMDHILALLVNYGLALTPTLYSLLIEPFSDYPKSGVNDHVFAAFSLLGFYRYNDTPVEKRSYEQTNKSVRQVNIYSIEDFSVEYDGAVYFSTIGRLSLPVKYESGMEIQCKLISAKVLQGGLHDKIQPYFGKMLSWQATGVKRKPATEENEIKSDVPDEIARVNAIDRAKLVGEWESYQSHKTISGGMGKGEGVEQNQTIHCIYSFYDDGMYRLMMSISGKETRWSGKWTLQDGVIVTTLKNQDGEPIRQALSITQYTEGCVQLRHRHPEKFAEMLVEGAVKATKAEYNDGGELSVSLAMDVDMGNGQKTEIAIQSTYSPLILEKMSN